MKISLEMSYYPFLENAENEVNVFLERLKKYPDLKIITNFMSTQIIGEFQQIMEFLSKELHDSFNCQKSVFVIKISNTCDETCDL